MHHHAVRRPDPEQPPTPGEMETMALHSRQARCLLQSRQRPLEGRSRTRASSVSRIRSRATRHTKNPEEGSRVLGRHVSPGCRQSTIAHTALGIKSPARVRAATWTTSGLGGTLMRRAGDEDSTSASPGAHVPAAVGGVILQTVQQRAVNLGDVLSAHSFVRRPFCPHTDSLANPKIKNV